jgi:hypothetical protein
MTIRTACAPVAALVLLAAGSAISSAEPGVTNCQPVNGSSIDIVNGPISCVDAYATAGRYQADGEKYQQIDAFTCYSGNAMTAPVVLSCVSDVSEFAVSTVVPG